MREETPEQLANGPLPLSSHATRRSQQRGIRHEAIDFVYATFDVDRDVGDGRRALSCSRGALDKALREGAATALVDGARRLVLIIGADGVIVTVMNSQTSFARFQRGHARLGARQRAKMAERRRRGGGYR